MMRSLYAGVQGLRTHQMRMDVIGNNIANVNTTAFKASRVTFSDMYSETLSAGSRPTSTAGGTNPRQVGLGVGLATIDVIQTPGSLQLTGNETDLAISGNGFFVLRDGTRYAYTRAGNFDFDKEGYLVNPATGQRVQGWVPNSAGLFPSRDASNMTDVQIQISENQLAQATTQVAFAQALNASSPVGATHQTASTVIDSLGREQTINLTFTKVADNSWDVVVSDPNGTQIHTPNLYAAGSTVAPVPAVGPPATGRIQFNTDGSLMDYDADATTPWEMNIAFTPVGADPMSVALDFSQVIQPALPGDTDTSDLMAVDFNGYTTGTLSNINIDAQGTVTGFYSNGNFREIAQVATAVFANPGGLTKVGNNNWVESVNSGLALIGTPSDGGRGAVVSANLEMSNVDISAEFTNMIVTQRGFQANSRVITTTDELLQEVVNLKR